MLKSWGLFLACVFLFLSFLQPFLLNAGFALQHGGGCSDLASVWESSAHDENSSITPEESTIVVLVNGTEAYDNALEIEAIGLNQTLSGYSFRAGGSRGANETAKYIMKQFQSFGLETHNESFQFTNWNLLSKPTLDIDEDGDPATTYDQINIRSFQSTHYSWPTPQGGVFEDLVVLPLPSAANITEIGPNPIDADTWNAIDITGKILLIGREVTWSSRWEQFYFYKLYSQPPAAVILTWWYDWMSFTPMMSASAGGRPISSLGPYYWNLHIPVGDVDYDDGLWIRNRENSFNVSAVFKIESIIGSGPHYNVVGKLRGYAEPDKSVIVCGHYDSVMTASFCDNGAGTAGVIEAARVLTDAAKKDLYHPRYSIVFVAFDGEEIGGLGSMYYIKQHVAEMTSIFAVVCLDCVGNENLVVYPTVPFSGFDLDQVLLQAASDLGVSAALADPAHARALPSDHESFRDPFWANQLHYYWWGTDLGIAYATPVVPSSLLTSEPLLYSDKWAAETPGWIHTSNDNSTSTQVLGWVEIDNLQNHIMIAVLSILRVSPTGPDDMTPPTIGNPSQYPSGMVDPGQEVKVSVSVTDAQSGVENVTIYHTVDEGVSWQSSPMKYNASVSLYESVILGQPAGTLVEFRIIAYDKAGNVAMKDNSGKYYTYRVQFAQARVELDVGTLNLETHGGWIIGHVELSRSYNASHVEISSIRLNSTVPVDPQAPVLIQDYDSDGILDLTVYFNRTAVSELIISKGKMAGGVILTVTGRLPDRTVFEGSHMTIVRMRGDVNVDGKVDIRDLTLASQSFGTCQGQAKWNPVADENEDNQIDMRDLVLAAKSFGKMYI